MTGTPCCFAWFAIPAAEAESTGSSTRTLAPLVSAASACCCCFAASWSALRVDHLAVRAHLLELCLELRAVLGLVAGGLGLGQEQRDLAALPPPLRRCSTAARRCRRRRRRRRPGRAPSTSAADRSTSPRAQLRTFASARSLHSRCWLNSVTRVRSVGSCGHLAVAGRRDENGPASRRTSASAPSTSARSPSTPGTTRRPRRRWGSRSGGSPRRAGRAGRRPGRAQLAADDHAARVEQVARGWRPRGRSSRPASAIDARRRRGRLRASSSIRRSARDVLRRGWR